MLTPEVVRILDVAAIIAEMVYNDPEQNYVAKRLAGAVIRMAEVAARDRQHAPAR
jgi:hypothetical protein